LSIYAMIGVTLIQYDKEDSKMSPTLLRDKESRLL